MTTNEKLEKATENVQKMEKHFNMAIDLMTEALKEKSAEIEMVKQENAMVKEAATVLTLTTIASYFIGYLAARFVGC
jgi:multidrug resistance efflux pump